MKNLLIKSIFAGLMIGISGTIYLKLDNKIIGSLLFSFGLLVICCKNYFLYTGKVGYLVTKTYKFKEIGVIVLGNLIGTMVVGLLIRYSYPTVVLKATSMLNDKFSNTYPILLILSFFCGILMYLAVDTFYKNNHILVKVVVLIIAVSIFILSGFEHSIADLFYVFLSGKISISIVLKLLVILLGNGLGANLFSYADLILSKESN